jgi:hypothetical protein
MNDGDKIPTTIPMFSESITQFNKASVDIRRYRLTPAKQHGGRHTGSICSKESIYRTHTAVAQQH